MADIRLVVGLNPTTSYDQMSTDLSDLVVKLDRNPPRIKVGLQIDQESINSFRSQIEQVYSSMGSNTGAVLFSGKDLQRFTQAATASFGKIGTTLKHLGDAFSRIDVSKLHEDLGAIRVAIEAITSALPKAGSALDALSQDGSSGLVDTLSRLNEINEMVKAINSKDFSMKFSMSGKASSTEIFEASRTRAQELLVVVRELQNDFFDLNRISHEVWNKSISASGHSGTLQTLGLEGRTDLDELGSNISMAQTNGELSKTVAVLETLRTSYTAVLDVARQFGLKIHVPDTTALDAAEKEIEDIRNRGKEAHEVLKQLAQSTNGGTSTGVTAVDSVSNTTSEQTNRIRTMCSDISSLLDELRRKIEETFDLSSVAVDSSKIVSELNSIKKELDVLKKNVGADISPEGIEKAASVSAKLKEIATTNARLTSGYKSAQGFLNDSSGGDEQIKKSEELKNKYVELQTAVESVRKNRNNADQEAFNNIYRLQAELQKLINEYGNAKDAGGKLTSDSGKPYYDALEKIRRKLEEVTNYQNKFTAAKSGKTSVEYAKFTDYASELDKLKSRLQNDDLTPKEFANSFSDINKRIGETVTTIRSAGEATQSWGNRIGKLSKKFTEWFGITRVVMAVINELKKMVRTVVDIDTAMTELKKVTNETDATYTKFLENATVRAKKLGATVTDTVTATADFARLGYNIEQAEDLADAAIIYKNVGDGIEDINQASESIIATLQAYSNEISPDQVMQIVDKFNSIGNSYAISSGGIGEALLRSAAAMQAANNTLDETIALTTAANTVVQDPEKVGKIMPNDTVMYRKKIAISVKSQRWSRPRKDFVVYNRKVRSFTG